MTLLDKIDAKGALIEAVSRSYNEFGHDTDSQIANRVAFELDRLGYEIRRKS